MLRLSLALFFLFSIRGDSACIPVAGDQILARDAAQAIKQFEAVPPEIALGWAPAIGAKRIVSRSEWVAIGTMTNLQLDVQALPSAVCFERASQILTASLVEQAIKTTLGNTAQMAQVEVIDFSRIPLPLGPIEFPRATANPSIQDRSDTAFLWRGFVKSNSGGTAPCWARVIVRGLRTAIRAKVDLKPGHIIRSNEIEQVQVPYCPLRHIPVESLTGYIGMMVRRPLRTGDILAPSQVVAAPIIARGSTIPVLVISGGAQLRFEARADTDGRAGQPITLTNLRSRRHFVGIVRIDGSVVVHSRFGSRSDRL